MSERCYCGGGDEHEHRPYGGGTRILACPPEPFVPKKVVELEEELAAVRQQLERERRQILAVIDKYGGVDVPPGDPLPAHVDYALNWMGWRAKKAEAALRETRQALSFIVASTPGGNVRVPPKVARQSWTIVRTDEVDGTITFSALAAAGDAEPPPPDPRLIRYYDGTAGADQ